MKDWGRLAHEAAEQHMQAVLAAEEDPELDSPAFGPYCGCQCCDIREILAGAWVVIEQMMAALREHPAAGPPGP